MQDRTANRLEGGTLNIAMENSMRQELLYRASIAETAGRYRDMADAMFGVAALDPTLDDYERYLLHKAYRHYIGERLASWKTLTGIEQREEKKPNNEGRCESVRRYKRAIEDEVLDIVNKIVGILDGHRISRTKKAVSIVDYYKLKGDVFRYLAEMKTGVERQETANTSLDAYECAWGIALCDLAPTDVHRLALVMNFAVLRHDILNDPERAKKLCAQALSAAMANLEHLDDASFNETTNCIRHLRERVVDSPSRAGSDEPDSFFVAAGAVGRRKILTAREKFGAESILHFL